MLYFIYGPDGYRVRQAVQTVTASLRASAFDLGEPDSLRQIDSLLKNTSLFSERRCAVVSGAFAQKNSARELIERIRATDLTNSQEITLVITETGLQAALARKNKELFAALTGPGFQVIGVDFLGPSQLNEWVNGEFSKRGAAAEPAAVRELIGRTGQESWALIQEIEKLCNYSGNRAVSADMVRTLVAEREDSNIFRFTDALAARDKPRALALLYKEFQGGQEPYSVLSAVIYQFRNLLMAKDLTVRSAWSAGLAQKLGVPPFVAQKLTSAAKKFELPELTARYERLAFLDTRTKQGRLDLKDALYLFVLGSF